MPAEKSLAIVLRVVEFSETSCVVTLFTEHFGKIGALAKGARRPKSPFDSALDLLSVCRIVFIHKSSDVLDLLTEAKLERRFRSATTDLTRLYAGYYVAELLGQLTDLSDPHQNLFREANETLLAIDSGEPLAPVVTRFELMALRDLGHLPSLSDCVGCGKPIEMAKRIAFGPVAGGVLCPSCRIGKRPIASVSAPVLEALKVFSREDESWRTFRLDKRVRGELRGVLNSYMSHLIGRRPRMHAYLGELTK